MKQPISKLKEFFGAFKIPTASNFSDIFDSYFHKDGKIPASNVEGWTDDSAVNLEPNIMELPELDNKNKTVKVLGGAHGKTYTYKGAQLHIDADHEAILFWDGTLKTWKIQASEPMPTPEGTNEVVQGGVLLVNQDGVYKVKSGVDYTFDSIIARTPVSTIVQNNGGFSVFDYETSTFAGWADEYGVIKNFNKIILYHKDLTGTGTAVKATKAKYQVRENDRNGTLLASGEIDLNFANGQIGFIEIPLGKTIKNDNNSNIWVGYWGNGNMPLPRSKRSHTPFRKIRYKVISDYATDFSVSSDTFSDQATYPYVIFALEEEQISAKQSYADNVLVKADAIGELLVTENRAIAGKKVYNAVKPFGDLIKNSFVTDSSEVVGGTSILTSTSTFAGWGQLMGKKKNFDAVKFPFRPYDANNLPTYVTMTIRKGSDTGAILVEKTITGTFLANTTYDLIFVLDSRFENIPDDDLFVQYHSNGYFCCIGTGSGQTSKLYYTTAKGNNALGSTTTNQNILRTEFLKGAIKGSFTDLATQQIQEIAEVYVAKTPSFLLTSQVWVYPGFQYNIFNKNVCVPDYGDNLENYRLDFNGSVGKQMKRGFRINSASENLNANVTVHLKKGRNILQSKIQTILSAAANNGAGIERKLFFFADSTGAGAKISSPLRDIFANDVMKIKQCGTQGSGELLHDGRSGYTVSDYATIGRKLYMVPVTGITVAPSIGAVYQQAAGNNFTVTEVNITNGTGNISLTLANGSADLAASGTLTKISGNGDILINYSSRTVGSGNPLYNPATGNAEFSYYLTSSGQTIGDGDWVVFQLGINDMFTMTNLADAEAKATISLNQLKYLIADIHSHNPNIRIGIVVTFGCADQDGFAANYNNDYDSETYRTTGLVTWQNKLIAEFDNIASRNSGIYLISAHLDLDTEKNFPNTALYGLQVRGLITTPTSGAIYTSGNSQLVYNSGDILNGSGILYFTGDSPPTSMKGSITKSSGTGDNSITYSSYMISATTFANSRNSFPVIEQTNGVHPSVPGNWQIASLVAGLIKWAA
ncbi:SGNH/GDSL hydrolase family protein [Sphingobacterium siyangense]|uniref:SGNH/GDSL hydrolase family protein n=1 Tax=Sphingobacterium siyangense TaxID=459529 RepID=UPI003DA300AF